MKLETYLNALEYAAVDYWSEHFKGSYPRRRRQGKAFRSRILRMDAEKDKTIKKLDDWVKENAALVHVHTGPQRYGPND